MSSERPFQNKYVKDLDAHFKEYRFNKRLCHNKWLIFDEK